MKRLASAFVMTFAMMLGGPAALAEAPRPRPALAPAEAPAPRPAARPDETSGSAPAPRPRANASAFAPRVSPVPPPRKRAADPPPPRRAPIAPLVGRPGPVCGDARLIGREIAVIAGTQPGCGVARPVRVRQVSGVALAAPIRVDCDAARAFADWMEAGAKPAAARALGAALKSVRPVASYVCRTRNGAAGARLSEHAKGRAIDVAGFTMADGRRVDVLGGWRGDGAQRRFLRGLWSSACVHFGTVLGPESDRHHQDHFHFDVAAYRNGAYCR